MHYSALMWVSISKENWALTEDRLGPGFYTFIRLAVSFSYLSPRGQVVVQGVRGFVINRSIISRPISLAVVLGNGNIPFSQYCWGLGKPFFSHGESFEINFKEDNSQHAKIGGGWRLD